MNTVICDDAHITVLPFTEVVFSSVMHKCSDWCQANVSPIEVDILNKTLG